ncbi:hypothetical protein A3A38_00405 [Candidatus Kaiserbacteria bacterium RIFCSPLOWO2_01_FULL_53_17]|uniref:Uncharacterized protein n=1 Tax=Candidatus Kaiserbacteria bacterium RIFCSPLOWO2_01_FULL_53_17 TaxID=1798511 RepID=A0A1F6EH97_9BACT|nr:MAG: hypothetical protein A3A38_00405 [Candidatus Kaiserbacteria bacterium RIFCSPLOWO2_01_FULL_53_17]
MEEVGEEPRIVPVEPTPEISRVPPGVQDEIIRRIENEEREEGERERHIDEIIRRKKSSRTPGKDA